LGNRSWHGVLWSFLIVLILLSFMTPFIIFMIPFIMVPVVLLYVTNNIRSFAIYYAVSLIVLLILSGLQGAFLISVSLFFLPTVWVMGNLYRKKATARNVVTAGTLTLLAESLISLLIANATGLNPIAKFKSIMSEYVSTMPAGVRELLPSDQDAYINLMVQVIPLDLIIFSLFFVFFTHGVSRWLLKKTGHAVPGLSPIREWMLPKSFVWLYLITFVIDLFINPASQSFIVTLLMNLLPLLILAFVIQAISFLFFVAHSKKWGVILPIVGILVLVFMPLFLFLYSLLGVFDVAFPIRERFKKKL
jgi:uncharacterized protein YybS (DUF2232 family)